MSAPEQLRRTVRALLDSQIQAVLATQHQQQPYTSLMAFAVTPDLRHIVFATFRATRKYANLLDNPRASLLIDNRCNNAADYGNAVAISAQGAICETDAARRAELLPLYLAKHPRLRDFVTAADCALLQMNVECYYVVSEFQSVAELRMACN
jgi:heme iron utilization protein